MDDRTYKDILDQAISLIPHYCPEWTNHNPTDPGITLLELFSWMTEMTIYRLNKVPEKTYLALLDLLGLTLSPPQSARVLLTFHPVDGYKDAVFLKQGLQVGTEAKNGSEPVVFETEKSLSVCNIALAASYGRLGDKITDNVSELKRKGSFRLFDAAAEIERKIYIEASVFEFLKEPNTVSLTFDTTYSITSVNDEIIAVLSWEYWNGSKWVDLEVFSSVDNNRKEDNQIFFKGPLDIVPTAIQNAEGYFLRASVRKIPDDHKCFSVLSLLSKLIFQGDGLLPDVCLSNQENMVFTPIDFGVDFKIFPKQPKYNDALYIASDEVLSKTGSRVSIRFGLGEMNDGAEGNRSIQYRYEYWNGRDWIQLGFSSVSAPARSYGTCRLDDDTYGFSRSGILSFDCPADIQPCEVNGSEHFWLRIRISAGDLGKGGQYQAGDSGSMEWGFDEEISMPFFSRLRLSYDAKKTPVRKAIVYDNFSYRDLSQTMVENARSEEDKEEISLFALDSEDFPVVYFGFDRAFPGNNASVYFRIDERNRVLESANYFVRSSSVDKGVGKKRTKRFLTLSWQYWNGEGYTPLSVNDYTDGFHESGFVEFQLPDDFSPHEDFGKDLFWVRVVFEAGSFESIPVVKDILLNSVYGIHRRTHRKEILGGSGGTPNQGFELVRKPVLPGLRLMVKEASLPPEKEREEIIREEGKGAIQVKKLGNGKEEVWVRYHCVDNFLSSKPYSRHYLLDFQENRIVFGDGVKGVIPPRVKNNIVAEEYWTGGGEIGNVGAGSIRVLRENIPFLAGVENPYPAEGGADFESLDGLKARAAGVMKSLNRAVTAEDFEWLSLEASASVARAKCLSRLGSNGEIRVVIVPRIYGEVDADHKPYPTQELLRRVKAYLFDRKMIGTRLRVEGPVYTEVKIATKIVLKKEVVESGYIKEKIEKTVKRYLHPLYGGEGGNGWGFGFPLQKDVVGAVIEKIPEVHHVEEVSIRNLTTGFEDDAISLGEDALLFVQDVTVEERKSVY
ncbi:putative baseplate assembly protein [Sediminispirochaeta bajacaliforniensis]|uniref:putative baseplate assembly protein n=1 Tax=Sediminispirochaeta bajacaliforniensis TaxID=148 RepID=UPI0012B638B7|nr:putative baseplate assembly protein [Sediminispirochaeta bajacaliforniensis]